MIPAEYKKLSDEELIHRFVHRGEQAVMNILFERYSHLVLGLCFKYLKEKEASKDAVQQIFIKLIDDLPRFRIERFKPWLFQVSRNFCLMQLRKAIPVVNNEFITNESMESDEGWHQKIEEEHLYQQLEFALSQLGEEQATCIKLFYLEKLTYSEIAERTKYTVQEVKSYLQNGKRNLKIKMEALADERK